jgi:hypothetical protein
MTGISNGSGYLEQAVAPGKTTEFVTTNEILTQSQCNQMNKGLFWMNTLSTIAGAAIMGLRGGGAWSSGVGGALGGTTSGIVQSGADYKLNNLLCGGGTLF